MLFSKRGLCALGVASLVQHTASQNWDGASPYASGLAPDDVAGDGWNSAYPAFEGKNSSYPALLGGTDGCNQGASEIASSFSMLESEDASSFSILAAKDFYLRVLPLGASIVEGVASLDGNWFRKLLRQQLRWKGWKVNMVETKNNGNMANNVSRLALNLFERS